LALRATGLLDRGVDTMNAVMKNEADEMQSYSLSLTEKTTWSKTDFYDASHLNAQGNLKLAELIAEDIVKNR